MTQLSLLDAKDARDEALQRIESNSGDWFSAALGAIPMLQYSSEFRAPFTGEDIRHAVIGHVGKPHHPNAFGALIAQAKRKGYIIATGKYVPSRDKHNHASMIAEYRWPEVI